MCKSDITDLGSEQLFFDLDHHIQRLERYRRVAPLASSGPGGGCVLQRRRSSIGRGAWALGALGRLGRWSICEVPPMPRSHHGEAPKDFQGPWLRIAKAWKQWVRVESCNVAVPFEESWPNPTDAPEEAGTQIQLLAGELMLPLSR